MKKIFSTKIFSLFLTLCILGSLLAVAPPAEAAAKKLNRTRLNLTAGGTFTLKVKGTSAKVKWTSSKKSVAAVSSKGKVTAKKAGSATITAKVSKKKYTCKVSVKAKSNARGSKANPLSAYANNTFTYYEEGKKKGKFSMKLLQFVMGEDAAKMAKNNSTNPVPEDNQEYIYFKFQIQYISGSQTINARNVFNYYYNIYGNNSTTPIKNLDWGFFFENVDDLGTTTLSPGNKIICSKAILVNQGFEPITYCIQTGKNSYTWFTTEV